MGQDDAVRQLAFLTAASAAASRKGGRLETVLHRVRRAFAKGRAACAYLAAGDVRGAAGALADGILRTVFCASPGPEGEPCGECASCRMQSIRLHPDLHILSPEKKSRVISVDAAREKLVTPLSASSFAGGWKAGLVEFADCLNESSSNALLKTLEEPPPRTMFLLLSDRPENLLATITSRCQRIDAGRAGSSLTDGEKEAVLSALAAPGRDGVLARAAAAAAMEAVFAQLEERAADETAEEAKRLSGEGGIDMDKDAAAALASARFRGYRRDAAILAEAWFRDIAAVKCAGPDAPLAFPQYRDEYARRAAAMDAARCFANVEAMEALSESLARNVPQAAALAAAFANVATGGGGRAE